MRDNDRARRDAETDDERQHRLNRMRESTSRDSETERATAEIESDER